MLISISRFLVNISETVFLPALGEHDVVDTVCLGEQRGDFFVGYPDECPMPSPATNPK